MTQDARHSWRGQRAGSMQWPCPLLPSACAVPEDRVLFVPLRVGEHTCAQGWRVSAHALPSVGTKRGLFRVPT